MTQGSRTVVIILPEDVQYWLRLLQKTCDHTDRGQGQKQHNTEVKDTGNHTSSQCALLAEITNNMRLNMS